MSIKKSFSTPLRLATEIDLQGGPYLLDHFPGLQE